MKLEEFFVMKDFEIVTVMSTYTYPFYSFSISFSSSYFSFFPFIIEVYMYMSFYSFLGFFFEVIRIKIGCVNTRTKNREHISNYKKRSRNKTLTETLKLDWIMFFRIKYILFRLLLIHQNRKIHMKGIKSSKSDFLNTLFLF
jgi:hypothetical protein